MSGALPDVVDAWRMVTGRRRFQGSLPLREMTRLRDSLAAEGGEAHYEIEFGRDEFGVPFLALRVEARLPLICQRTLDPFELPVSVSTRLGLIAHERDEAALPPGFESLLVPTGELRPAEVIEDELILSLPVVPIKPGAAEGPELVYSSEPEESGAKSDEPGPFAVLAKLRKH